VLYLLEAAMKVSLCVTDRWDCAGHQLGNMVKMSAYCSESEGVVSIAENHTA